MNGRALQGLSLYVVYSTWDRWEGGVCDKMRGTALTLAGATFVGGNTQKRKPEVKVQSVRCLNAQFLLVGRKPQAGRAVTTRCPEAAQVSRGVRQPRPSRDQEAYHPAPEPQVCK